jgi:hypothetical protein
LDGFKTTRRAADGPLEELFPGHWARRGVPPGSEPLIRFLDTLGSQDWDRLCEGASFSEPGLPGEKRVARPSPIISWPFGRLNRTQQRSVQEYYNANGARNTDFEKVVVYLTNRNGSQLIMRLFDGTTWNDAPLVVAMEGPSLDKLMTASQDPLFIEEGPDFTKGAPAFFRKSAKFDLDWKSLDYAQAAVALGNLLGVPIISDYYTLSPRAKLTISAKRIPASEILISMNKAFGCYFAWREGMILVRRGDWPELDKREIPESILTKAVDKKNQAGVWSTLDTRSLAWLAASISPTQIPCLGSFVSRENPKLNLATEAMVIGSEYEPLRLLGSLNRNSQDQLLSGNGLMSRSAYQSSPSSYLSLMRNRFPWLLEEPGISGGVLRLVLAPGGTVLGLPDVVQPLQFEVFYRSQNRPVRVGMVTGIPWIPERTSKRR